MCKSVFARETPKKWNQEWKQKQYGMFNFCNIFDLLSSKIQKKFLDIFLQWTTQKNLKRFHWQVVILSYLLNREMRAICSHKYNRKLPLFTKFCHAFLEIFVWSPKIFSRYHRIKYQQLLGIFLKQWYKQ